MTKIISSPRGNGLRREPGITLVEVLFALVMAAVLILAVVKLVTPMTKYFQRERMRQEANLEMRACLSTIERVMSNARMSTLVIATPPSTPTVQFSSATFQGVDGSFYTITWSAKPMNTVHLQKTVAGVTNDTLLANHVTGLNFGVDDHDPGVVRVKVVLTVPLDTSGAPDSFMTVVLPDQTIRLMGS